MNDVSIVQVSWSSMMLEYREVNLIPLLTGAFCKKWRFFYCVDPLIVIGRIPTECEILGVDFVSTERYIPTECSGPCSVGIHRSVEKKRPRPFVAFRRNATMPKNEKILFSNRDR